MSIGAPDARWHVLRRLTELPGPEWRLPPQQREDLCLVRAFEDYVETVCVDDGVMAVNRQPITGRSTQTITTANFAGSFPEAMEFLRHPPQRERERPLTDERDIQWPPT